MARGVRLAAPGHAWAAVAAGFAAAAALAALLPREALDWQPQRAAAQPWRAFSAAFVHWSAGHLAANGAATAVVAAFGVVTRLPPAAAGAWLAAWPLTHVGLLLRQDLLHYGGLSGVLHAGVAVAALWLALEARRRGLGVLLGAALVAKVLLEAPWGPPLRAGIGWDIALAPAAHASGALAGAACALGVIGWRRLRLASPPYE